MIRRILLDMDDVLNHLTCPALDYNGLYCPESRYNTEWGYDIIKAANTLADWEDYAYTKKTFWDSFPESFWSDLPVSSCCLPLLYTCEGLVGTENVCILSSPTKGPECLSGKLTWIHKNLPKRFHRQYLIGPRKYFCASPESLLIDDCTENVLTFQKHGGHAILVPRPWNGLHKLWTDGKTMDYVAMYLNRLEYCGRQD